MPRRESNGSSLLRGRGASVDSASKVDARASKVDSASGSHTVPLSSARPAATPGPRDPGRPRGEVQAKLDRIAASREEVEMVAAPAARTREVQEMLARMDQKFESLLGELARDRTALAESLATDRATLAQVGSNVDLLQQGIQREQADAGSEEAARAVATEAAWRMEQKFTSLQAELSQIKSLPLSSPDRASIERAKIAGDAALRMDQKFEALRNELMQMLAEKEKLGQVTAEKDHLQAMAEKEKSKMVALQTELSSAQNRRMAEDPTCLHLQSYRIF